MGAMRFFTISTLVLLACCGRASFTGTQTSPGPSGPSADCPAGIDGTGQPQRVVFPPLPMPFQSHQLYELDLVVVDCAGGRATQPANVTLTARGANKPMLIGATTTPAQAGLAAFRIGIDRATSGLVLTASLPNGVETRTDPFDVVDEPPPWQGTPWMPAGPGGGGVGRLAIAPDDPDTIFAPTERGLYRSHDGGATWSKAPARGARNPSLFGVLCVSSLVLYASSDHLYRSLDGGDTFEAIPTDGWPRDPESIQLALQPGTGELWALFFGLRESTALLRFDGVEQRWVAIPGVPALIEFAFAGPQPGMIYGSDGSQFLVSHDNGATWTIQSAYPGPVYWLSVNPKDASLILAVAAQQGVLRSNDGGVSWSRVDSHDISTASFAGERRAYAVPRTGSMQIERSDDGGMTWGTITLPTIDSWHLAFDPRNADVLFASGETYPTGPGVHKSLDGGRTWKHSSEGMHAARIEAVSTAPRMGAVFVAMEDLGLYRTTDRGMSFEHVSDIVARVTESPDGALYATAREGLFRSDDGGSHWNAVKTDLDNHVFAVDPHDANRLILAFAGRVFRSADRGSSWTEVFSPSSVGISAEFASLLFDGDLVYAAALPAYRGKGGLFRSDDGGLTWQVLAAGSWNTLTLDPLDPHALLGLEGGKIVRSTDRGTSWTELDAPSNHGWRSLAVDASGRLWAGADSWCDPIWSESAACSRTGGGVFSTDVHGGRWVGTHPIIEGLSVRDVVVDPNDPATVYLGTEEAGLWLTHTDGR